MVDEGRVARLLRDVADRVARIRRTVGVESRGDDGLWLDAVKYLLVTTVEGCVDVAQHVGASEQYPSPASNADALRQLGERGVIAADLADELARAVGFRNVLVHQYAEVDDRIVRRVLDRLEVFDHFVAQVSAWLAAQRP